MSDLRVGDCSFYLAPTGHELRLDGASFEKITVQGKDCPIEGYRITKRFHEFPQRQLMNGIVLLNTYPWFLARGEKWEECGLVRIADVGCHHVPILTSAEFEFHIIAEAGGLFDPRLYVHSGPTMLN